MSGLGRRRLLAVMAASAAGLALPAGAAATTVRWTGVALGAAAELVIRHPDRRHAAALVDAAVAEIRRLERVFSLFDQKSALVRLNHAGRLEAPPFELVDLLAQARSIHAATGGGFDPTIQPLWRLHAAAAAAGHEVEAGALAAAHTLIGLDQVSADGDAVSFARPGMALTLNGIAQGYITDRIADLLRAGGLDHVLVDLGEIRAAGESTPGRPWRIGLGEGGDAAPETVLSLADGAIATSRPLGTTLDAAGTVGHIIDPRTGRPATGHWRRVTVRHRRATIADGLSTAGVLLPRTEIEAALGHFSGAALIVAVGPAGQANTTAAKAVHFRR